MSVKFSGKLAIKQIEFIFRIEERNWRQQVLTDNHKHMFALLKNKKWGISTMGINGISQSYGYWETAVNDMKEKRLLREAAPKAKKQPVTLDISDEGKNKLREMASSLEPKPDDIKAQELTIRNTNEVAWEHYTAMRERSSLTLKDGNYNAQDVMQSIMDTYEARYHEIVKAHENGDREVSYELTGKQSLTLDEDLAGLDEAFKMRLANLEGYIACQQTNKAFANPDSAWYFRRSSPQGEEQGVFQKSTIGASKLSRNREEILDKLRHTVIHTATEFGDIRAGLLKAVREEKGAYDYADIANACEQSYARLYAEIEKRYENGDEQYYDLSGTPLTKQDELAWLKKEYENEIAWQQACRKAAKYTL